MRDALVATCEKRGSAGAMARWRRVLDEVAQDAAMLALWKKFARKNPYAARIAFQETRRTAKEVMEAVVG